MTSCRFPSALLLLFCAVSVLTSGYVLAGGEALQADVRAENSGRDKRDRLPLDLIREKEAYEKKAREKLRYLDAKIAHIEAQAREKTTATARKVSDELRAKSRLIKDRLAELRSAGNGAWDRMRRQTEEMLRELDASYRRAVAGLHSGTSNETQRRIP